MTSSGAAWSDFPPEAEAELDGSWIRIARKSGNVDIATRVVERVAERFWLLARYRLIGRRRDDDLRLGLLSSHFVRQP